jgi:hypothetical protein
MHRTRLCDRRRRLGRTRRSAAPPRLLIVTALEVRRGLAHNSVALLRKRASSLQRRRRAAQESARKGRAPEKARPADNNHLLQAPHTTGGTSAGGSKLPSALVPGRSKQPATRVDRNEGEARERSVFPRAGCSLRPVAPVRAEASLHLHGTWSLTTAGPKPFGRKDRSRATFGRWHPAGGSKLPSAWRRTAQGRRTEALEP